MERPSRAAIRVKNGGHSMGISESRCGSTSEPTAAAGPSEQRHAFLSRRRPRAPFPRPPPYRRRRSSEAAPASVAQVPCRYRVPVGGGRISDRKELFRLSGTVAVNLARQITEPSRIRYFYFILLHFPLLPNVLELSYLGGRRSPTFCRPLALLCDLSSLFSRFADVFLQEGPRMRP